MFLTLDKVQFVANARSALVARINTFKLNYYRGSNAFSELSSLSLVGELVDYIEFWDHSEDTLRYIRIVSIISGILNIEVTSDVEFPGADPPPASPVTLIDGGNYGASTIDIFDGGNYGDPKTITYDGGNYGEV